MNQADYGRFLIGSYFFRVCRSFVIHRNITLLVHNGLELV